MKQIVSCAGVLLVTAGLTVGLTSTANASILKTAPLYANGTDSVSCNAANVTLSTLDSLAVWIIDSKGEPVALNVCYDVRDGGTCTASAEAKGGFCAIVAPGPSADVRGNICIVDKDGNAKVALPAQ